MAARTLRERTGKSRGRKREPLALIVSALLAAIAQWGAVQAKATASADLKKMTVEELLDVQVTFTSRRPVSLIDAPAAIQLVTAQDIARSAATRIPEALRLASNLAVAQTSASSWAISARGFNTGIGNKLLVMIDGRTVYTPMFAGVFWDMQDTIVDDIDHIEIVSGPGGAVWGANAVNGVIGIVTKSAADTQGLLLKAAGGEQLDRSGAARYGGRFGQDGNFRFYGKYTEYDGSSLPNGSRFDDAAHSGRGGFRLDTPFGTDNTLTVQGDYYKGASGTGVPPANRVEFSGANLLGRWQRSMGTASGMALQFYVDRTDRESVGQFSDGVDTVDVDFQSHTRFGTRHNAVWGLGFRRIEDEFFSQSSSFAFLPSRLTHDLFSAFVQDEIELAGDLVRLTLGAKLEHNDYSGFETQPNVRVALKPADNQTLWAAVSRAIRAPARIDRDLYFPAQPPFLLAGGPDFESEVLLAHEAGYRVQPAERVSVDITAFYNDYDRLRSVEPANPPSPFPVIVRNGVEGHSHGAELNANVQATDRWRLAVGYRYMQLSLLAKSDNLIATSMQSEAHDSRQALAIRSMFDVTPTLQFDFAYRSVSRIANDAVPGYDELDVRLAWRPLEQLELSIAGQNLLHDRHAEFSPLASRREIERNLYGKVKWGF